MDKWLPRKVVREDKIVMVARNRQHPARTVANDESSSSPPRRRSGLSFIAFGPYTKPEFLSHRLHCHAFLWLRNI